MQFVPGIHIGFLDPGTRVLVATKVTTFELTVVEPQKAIINVSASDPRLQPARLGRLIGSSKDMAGKLMKDEWIGRGLYMNIQFKNLTFVTNPIISARIEGFGRVTGLPWHYDVFGRAAACGSWSR
jgi:hypothetical protein